MRLLLFLGLLLLTACHSPEPKEQVVHPAVGRASSPAETPGATLPAETESQTANAIDTDWLLVPGKSAGKTVLGQTSEEVFKRLGPADAGDAAMMHAVSVWYAGGKAKTGNSVAIFTVRDAGNDPAARIRQIRVNSPRFRTASGVGPGSTLEQIKAQYSLTPTNHYTEMDQVYTLFDAVAGIAFELNDKDICTSVIIHAANEAFSGTYLNFR